jgi:hypothetical protein
MPGKHQPWAGQSSCLRCARNTYTAGASGAKRCVPNTHEPAAQGAAAAATLMPMQGGERSAAGVSCLILVNGWSSPPSPSQLRALRITLARTLGIEPPAVTVARSVACTGDGGRDAIAGLTGGVDVGFMGGGAGGGAALTDARLAALGVPRSALGRESGSGSGVHGFIAAGVEPELSPGGGDEEGFGAQSALLLVRIAVAERKWRQQLRGRLRDGRLPQALSSQLRGAGATEGRRAVRMVRVLMSTLQRRKQLQQLHGQQPPPLPMLQGLHGASSNPTLLQPAGLSAADDDDDRTRRPSAAMQRAESAAQARFMQTAEVVAGWLIGTLALLGAVFTVRRRKADDHELLLRRRQSMARHTDRRSSRTSGDQGSRAGRRSSRTRVDVDDHGRVWDKRTGRWVARTRSDELRLDIQTHRTAGAGSEPASPVRLRGETRSPPQRNGRYAAGSAVDKGAEERSLLDPQSTRDRYGHVPDPQSHLSIAMGRIGQFAARLSPTRLLDRHVQLPMPMAPSPPPPDASGRSRK